MPGLAGGAANRRSATLAVQMCCAARCRCKLPDGRRLPVPFIGIQKWLYFLKQPVGMVQFFITHLGHRSPIRSLSAQGHLSTMPGQPLLYFLCMKRHHGDQDGYKAIPARNAISVQTHPVALAPAGKAIVQAQESAQSHRAFIRCFAAV